MGASMKGIKNRIKSVQSTRQITKAMELVASSKLRRAKERMESTRPYFEILHSTLLDIAKSVKELDSEYTVARAVKKHCYIVIAGDRGLAGGYNSNLFRLTQTKLQESSESAVILPVGKKAVDFFEKRGYEILTKAFAVVEDISISDCFEIARLLTQNYLSFKLDAISIVYTNFTSMLSQTPTCLELLPFKIEKSATGEVTSLTIYEPSPAAVFDNIVPEYIAGMIYGAVCEGFASELAARRSAMDSASKNADEMLESLSLSYNRARQASITQEITEIVAGSNTD